jgi:hypothetical protein
MRTFLGYVMIATLLGGLYALVMFGPLYVDHLEAKDICNSAFNRFKDVGAEGLKDDVLTRLNRVDWATHEERDPETDEMVVKPGLGLTEEDVLVEVDEQAKKVFLRVDYQRKVVLKPTEKVRVFKFHFERRDTPPNAF